MSEAGWPRASASASSSPALVRTLAVLAAAAVVSVQAETPPRPAPEPLLRTHPRASAFDRVAPAFQNAVFRTSVDLVTVDAAVIGADGRPVPDLGPDDFVIEVDGRPRPILSAQFVDQRAGRTGPAPLAATYFSSNERVDAGRHIIVAVDEAHIRRLEGRPALRAAAAFIDSLDRIDRIAVVGLSRVGAVDFTRDRVALKQRLSTLVGHTDPVFLQFNLGLHEAVEIADGSRTRLADVVLRECGRALGTFTSTARADDDAVNRDACPEQVEQEARAMAQHARTEARIALDALGALVESLRPIDGPKTLVVLSEGMLLDARLFDLSGLAAAARESRVTIYGLQMEAPLFEASQERVSPTLLQDIQLRGDGLERLAGAGRGAVFRLVGSDPRPFARIAEEISAYYLLAFEPLASDRDGRLHRIQVRLARGGGTVRARSVFRVPPVPISPRTREDELVALLRSSRVATELPVRVATFVFGEPPALPSAPAAPAGADASTVSARPAADPSVARVVVSVETAAPSGASRGTVLGYALVDQQGIIAVSGATRVSGARHAFSAAVPPGRYTLRVAGIDPLDRRGLVEREFVASLPAPAGGVRVSDLILAPVPPRPELPLHPIVDRVDEARVTAYLELYAPGAGALPSVTVALSIHALTADVPLASFASDVRRHGEQWATARATLALDRLEAGPYLAVARVLADGVELARVSRPFTRTLRP